MESGKPSNTAQRVAARRLRFDRVRAPYGNPPADELLARDIAGTVEVNHGGSMTRYLTARTAFFDRVVVSALERGLRQVVVAAAGYDGRALRYAKPGVRWFEVDHPDTQQDKQARLDRLGIRSDHIAFVPVDFTLDSIGKALPAAGFLTDVPALILCEGVAVYLDRPVLETLLRQLRGVTAATSRLAISLSVSADGPGFSDRRAAFESAVAALGEPARTVLTADDADALLAATGWAPLPPEGPRARPAGFVVAEPV